MITVTNKTALSVRNLSFFRDDRAVFEDFNLDVADRSYVALLGTNGSGKSTLLELILGTLAPRSGTITRPDGRIAFVPQRTDTPHHVPMTVRDAVSMGRWGTHGQFRRLRAPDHAVIDEQMERLGLTDLRNRQITELSGGQRQRTLIAGALAQQANLLLLDEPEAGLDTEARDFILDAIDDEVRRGTTVMIATHELESARRASRAVLLRSHAGGTIADGPPNEVLTDSMLAKAFI